MGKDFELKQITEYLASSMCYVDSDYIYRYVNSKYEEWFGVSKDDIIGKSVKELIPLTFSKQKSMYDNVMKGETVGTTVDIILPIGKRIILNVKYVPAYDVEGNNVGMYVYAYDVTEIHAKTEALEASQVQLINKTKTLEQYITSNLNLEQFAHVAAHDMKSPLRTISSFIGLLEKNLSNQLSGKEKEYVNIIKQGTKILNNMVTDLLEYSKVKSHGINIQRCKPKEIIDQVITFINTIKSQNAEINVAELPDYLFADKIKISQVFQNLISNAVKFVEAGVKPIVNIDCRESEEEYIFSVSDNGIGIAEELRDQIFEPFKQVNTKDKFEGTGLGLSICNRIINDHNGTIKIEESDLGGSKFVFTIDKKLSEKSGI